MPFTIYAGIAGDTDEGRFVSAGLYRKTNGDSWERIDHSFATPPEVHAILTDARSTSRVMIGTQIGIFASNDAGESWHQAAAPKPGLAVWSLVRHPLDSDCVLAGYEPPLIARSNDDGESWSGHEVSAGFPDVTAGQEMPKRITGIAVDAAKPQHMYASLEIGGLLKSTDGGNLWHAAIDGLYVVEDSVDLHGVVVSPARSGRVTVTTRVGTFRSDDGGSHWRKLPVPALREKGSYCRAITYAPGRPETLYLGAGNDFDGDRGALFISEDDGSSWVSIELPGPVKSTIFAIATSSRFPRGICCASKNGGVFVSENGGSSWSYAPLPRGAGHVFSLAIG